MRGMIAILLCMFTFSCSVDAQKPTHVAEVNLPTSAFPAFLATMDQAVAPFRLERFAAAPGFTELTGREVFYGAYKTKADSPYAALDMTDVKVAGRIKIFVYSGFFSDADTRKRFIAAVDDVIKNFGASLAPR